MAMPTREKVEYARMMRERADKRQMAIERRSMSPSRSSAAAAAAGAGEEAAAAAAAAAAGGDAVHVITLNHGEHTDSTLYRVPRGEVLQWVPGPSLLGRKVFLYTNYVDEGSEFVRAQYTTLPWCRPVWREAEGAGEGAGEGAAGRGAREELGTGVVMTDTELFCELRPARAGSFHYYFVYETDGGSGPAGSGWWGVWPRAGGAGAGSLAPDELCCLTVLTKCLGPLPRWERSLRPAADAGYNMIHFTPIQELGGSGSGYSLAAQLRLDPRLSADPQRRATYADVEAVVGRLRELGLLSMCDLVLNHTSNDTWWLAEHPEAVYNCLNTPRLRPAALLDAALAALSAAMGRGELAGRGAPARLERPEQLAALRAPLEEALGALRLHDCYSCDVDALVEDFLQRARNKLPAPEGPAEAELAQLKLIQDPLFRRRQCTVDAELSLRLFNVRGAGGEGAGAGAGEEARRAACGARLRRALERLNEEAAAAVARHLRAAADNVLAGASYHFLAADGPRLGEVSDAAPLVPRYFTWPAGAEGAAAGEAAAWGAQGAWVMAHNGWVMGADPLADFAAAGDVYLRRELVAWGDSVKLRYGAAPEDSPFLWAHMRQYCEVTAEVFHAVRLDNCHSTPLHVAEHMLDAARAVRPELLVLAELFTDSDALDNVFVNRLGVTMLVREAMSAGEPRELGRLVYRYGGRPVGSFLRPPRAAARPQVPLALFMDLTHDNPSPLQRRSVWDVLPSAALVAAAACGAGSTRGLDDLVPHAVHVVDETRLYAAGGEEGGAAPLQAARRALNALHVRLAREGYNEVYVDQLDEAVVAVTRHCPATRRSVLLVAVSAFSAPGEEPCGAGGGWQAAPRAPPPRPLRLEGVVGEVLLDMRLLQQDKDVEFVRDPHYINGLRGWRCLVQRGVPLAACEMFSGASVEPHATQLAWGTVRPGSVVVLEVSLAPAAAAALARTQRALAAPLAAEPPLAADLERLNALLYRCEQEERAATAGAAGCYHVPQHGPLVYAGLQGAVSLLATLLPADDLGHPLCDNLRAGDWLADYTWQRAAREHPAWGARAKELLLPLRELPRSLQPAYVAAALRRLHAVCARAALTRLRGAARGQLWRALALTSVQLVGAVPGALLPARPPQPTLSAGLPHFAAGYMRLWGRDTFVSLRGLLLLTGRAAEARAHLLGFAACLRHGLIPNLLDGGVAARYNCRDAVWWWLEALQQFVLAEGPDILRAPVGRLYPRDDSPAPPAPPPGEPPAAAATQPLHDTVQEALDTHFQGLVFRERNAGRGIDAHMSEAGFTVQLGIQPDTGFPFGGNDANAGTWMDKMGSSELAGTRGRPATPRDGSAVELVGLAYSAAAWLHAAHRAGHYPHAGLQRRDAAGAGATAAAWSWQEWADRIKDSFERHFWVPAEPSAADARPDLVHRRGIYKDSHGASAPWADYQLRCNFPIAMAVAPALFTPSRARRALQAAAEHLAGPLGMRTLDPADWAYRPHYDNSDQSGDPHTAHGYNYHQGPEWLWPLGYYLRARLLFPAGGPGGARAEAARVRAALGPLARELRAGAWRGLPELTGRDGAFCRDSCSSQAWSSAVILEVLEELSHVENARELTVVD